MDLSPATSLCLALLLLIPQTRSTTTGAPNTTAPCGRAWCGDLSISYPFWLAGTDPPECGGHQAFQVTCDNATSYFKNSLWTYRIQAIFYFKNSLWTRVAWGGRLLAGVLVGGHQEAAAAMGGVVPEGAALAAQHGGRRRRPPSGRKGRLVFSPFLLAIG